MKANRLSPQCPPKAGLAAGAPDCTINLDDGEALRLESAGGGTKINPMKSISAKSENRLRSFTVTLRWVGERLQMGHYTRVNQAVSRLERKPARKLRSLRDRLLALEK